MVQTEFPDDYYTTVDEVTERLEDEEFLVEDEYTEHYECDFCSRGVPYQKEPRVAMYFSDTVMLVTTPEDQIINQESILTHMATYCEECSHKLLFFPMYGATEARAMATITKTREYHNVEFTDISMADDGIPWDPIEAYERVTEIGIEAMVEEADDLSWGPENFVTLLMSLTRNMDIRDLFGADGEIDPQKLGEARERLQEVSQEYARKGMNKQTFKDIVQG